MQKRDKRNKIAKEDPESFTKVILNRIDYLRGYLRWDHAVKYM